jgi:hypothetical protein
MGQITPQQLELFHCGFGLDLAAHKALISVENPPL